MRVLDLTDRVAARFLERERGGGDADAARVAARIVRDVRRGGDAALRRWTRRLDGAEAAAASPRVSAGDLALAAARANPAFRRQLLRAARNVRRVARRQLPAEWTVTVEPGVRVSQRVRPLASVGCYVPGGRHPLVSTLVMTVIPAQVAGVRRIALACPRPSVELLAAAHALGVSEVWRVGGAQAVAALAYGTATIPAVEKIVGPGNRFVAAAKRLVSGDVAIDMVAGPTEVLVLATRGDPRFIAADLVAQAEHDPDATALLVTTSRALARRVAAVVERALEELPGASPARRALATRGAILVAPTLEAAAAFARRYAPEHLSLPGAGGAARDGRARERAILDRLDVAGGVFLGPWSAQSLGDFATGSNHSLPTGGTARVRGGLSAADFVRCVSVQEVSRAGLRRLAPVVRAFAAAEGLPAHGRSVEVRL